VAFIAHLLGFSWPAAWALGAVLAPTDASAVTAFGRALPTSWMTVLRAESLINDGTALVVLAVAIQAANHEHFGAGSIAWRAVQSYGLGIAVGLAVTLFMLLVL
jgi:CPA1 family monovalent cation:H+ antiporter